MQSNLFKSMDSSGPMQPRTIQSFNCIARQVSFRSPRGSELHKELHRSRHTPRNKESTGPNDGLMESVIPETEKEEDDSSISED